MLTLITSIGVTCERTQSEIIALMDPHHNDNITYSEFMRFSFDFTISRTNEHTGQEEHVQMIDLLS